MINFALLGAGRIGQLHASNIHKNPKAKLKYVFDTNRKLSEYTSKKYMHISNMDFVYSNS